MAGGGLRGGVLEAPMWLKRLMGEDGREPRRLGAGVTVIPPRRPLGGGAREGGHQWGRGHRLGR